MGRSWSESGRHRQWHGDGREGSSPPVAHLWLCGKPLGPERWHRAAVLGRCRARPQLWHALNGQGEGSWPGHKAGTQRGQPGLRKESLFQRSSLRWPFQPLIPCDMLWGPTGCGGRGELAVCRGRLREKSKGEKMLQRDNIPAKPRRFSLIQHPITSDIRLRRRYTRTS